AGSRRCRRRALRSVLVLRGAVGGLVKRAAIRRGCAAGGAPWPLGASAGGDPADEAAVDRSARLVAASRRSLGGYGRSRGGARSPGETAGTPGGDDRVAGVDAGADRRLDDHATDRRPEGRGGATARKGRAADSRADARGVPLAAP